MAKVGRRWSSAGAVRGERVAGERCRDEREELIGSTRQGRLNGNRQLWNDWCENEKRNVLPSQLRKDDSI